MKQNVLVTGYKKYDFKNNEGEVVKGFKLSYLSEDSDSDGENIKGYLPRQASISDMSLINELIEVPGVYEMNMKTVVGSNNKEGLKLVGMKLIKPSDFNVIFE